MITLMLDNLDRPACKFSRPFFTDSVHIKPAIAFYINSNNNTPSV